METLIIYDETGTIFFQASGDVQEPIGIPFMKVNIPDGKMIQKVDTTVSPNIPIFIDIQKSEIEIRIQQAEADNLTTLEALAEVYEMLLALQA